MILFPFWQNSTDDAISKQTYSKVLIFVSLYLKVILL